MPLTIARVATPQNNPSIMGPFRVHILDLTFDNSYPNDGTYAGSGEPFTAANIGLNAINLVLHDHILRHGTFATGGYNVVYDYTNSRFHVYYNYYSHNHDLHFNNADVVDGATTRINAGTNLLGGNTGADILVAGVANVAGVGGIVTRASPAANAEVGLEEVENTSTALNNLVLRCIVIGV